MRKNAKRPGRGAFIALAKRVIEEERRCWICTDEIDLALRFPHPLSGTGDHVVPLEDGGAELDRSNVRAAHRLCNQRRHVEWRRERRAVARAG